MRRKALPLLGGTLLGAVLVAAVWAAEADDKVTATVRPKQPAVTEEQAQAGRQLAEELSLAFEHASEMVKPAVVPVYVERVVEMGRFSTNMPFDPFGDDLLRRFFGDIPRQPNNGGRAPRVQGMGSGVIVSADGTILTNNHVVEKADKVYVLLDDNRLEATVVGTDPDTDLAVIRIKPDDLPKDLPVAELGSSDDLRVGQWVIAVGNPYELLSTVTAGIVSATGRESLPSIARLVDFIQTDASINPGNSGGALADLNGHVIGINTAISSPTGSSIGIGFAIPIDKAKAVMADLLDDGKIQRGYLGLVPQDIDQNLAKGLGLSSREGALVGDVPSDGPAYKAGIRTGDVITHIDGAEVKGANHLRNMVVAHKPGETVKVQVLRDGKDKTFDVKLGDRVESLPGVEQPQTESDEERLGDLGLQLQNLTPQLRRQLNADDDLEGVVVVGVSPGSVAALAGIEPGDVIQRVGSRPTPNVGALTGALADIKSGDGVALLVYRQGTSIFVGLEMP